MSFVVMGFGLLETTFDEIGEYYERIELRNIAFDVVGSSKLARVVPARTRQLNRQATD